MEIIFFEVTTNEKIIFSKALETDDLIFSSEPLTETTLPSQCSATILSIFVHSKITEKILKQFCNLKLLITRSTGIDHIDSKAAKQLGITVRTVPKYAIESVAEHVFALLLMLSKKMKQSCCSLAMYSAPPPTLEGFELAGKTMGIVGFGNIGKKVATIAHGFGMKIIIHDAFQKKDSKNAVPFVDLNTLYKQADIVTFHTSLTDETYHLFNFKTLQILKRGAIIVNTARGEIIETEALLAGIEQNIIAGVGLDVLEEELLTQNATCNQRTGNQSKDKNKRVEQNYILINHPNVIVTCHNAYNTREAKQRLTSQIIEIIETYKKG